MESIDNTRVSRRAFIATAAAGVLAGRYGTAHAAERRGLPAAGEPLRVGLIGSQGHFTYVLSGIPKVAGCTLAGVARAYPGEPIEDLRKKWKVWTDETRLYDDYRKMLDEVQPHIVGVCMPFPHNAATSIEAVRRGVHVIGEKPLATELEDLQRLREARDAAGVGVTAMLTMRLWPTFVGARKAVQDGVIGEPSLMFSQKSYKFKTRPDYYRQRETYGGTIPWIAIHAVDFMRYVSGLEYVNVTGRHANKAQKTYPGCEDCGALLFEMNNGGQAVLTFDYLRPVTAKSHGDDRLRIVGTKGVIDIQHAATVTAELTTMDAGPCELPRPKEERNLLVDFVEALRGIRPHIMAPDEPFRATEVCIKARMAADTHKTIEL